MARPRLSRPLPGLALAGLALALAASARGESLPVRLLAPEVGAVLQAGSAAELEWAPLEPLARLDGVEEWEAFLSFDGGATYPVRITPHLDRDLSRVRWRVPGVPTSDARLLLRFGDERRERYVELPQRFAIAGDPGAAEAFALAGAALAPGEPALPGHPGVVAWVEGSRRGGSLRQVVAGERPGLGDRFRPPESRPAAAVLGPAPAVPVPALRRAGETSPAAASASSPALSSAPRPGFDILLLTRRRNE